MAKRPNPEGEDHSGETGGNEKKSFPAYLESALRIPSSYPMGAPGTDDHMFTDMPSNESSAVGTQTTPGYFVVKYIPTYGVSLTPDSALNRATYNEFNVIRSKISGNRPYMPADHMIYRMCVASMRELYHFARRIYGILHGYSATNVYRPKHTLEAMGLDYDDWFTHSSELYQWLVSHKSALVPFPTVPIGTIDDKHVKYNEKLFTDGEIDSSQTYIMLQAGFYSYEVVDQVKGITIRTAPQTYSQFLTMWESMYSALQNSSDVYIIAADIRRAFEDRIVTDLPETAIDYVVPYEKFDDILTTIRNSTCVYTESYEAFKLTEDISNGSVICNPVIEYNHGMEPRVIRTPVMLNHLNAIAGEMGTANIYLATRLKPVLSVTLPKWNEEGTVVNSTCTINAMGTEVVVGYKMYRVNKTGIPYEVPFSSMELVCQDDAALWISMTRTMAMLSNFDWHPVVYLAQYNVRNISISEAERFEDVQNYVPISDSQLTQIHEAVLLTEFGF